MKRQHGQKTAWTQWEEEEREAKEAKEAKEGKDSKGSATTVASLATRHAIAWPHSSATDVDRTGILRPNAHRQQAVREEKEGRQGNKAITRARLRAKEDLGHGERD